MTSNTLAAEQRDVDASQMGQARWRGLLTSEPAVLAAMLISLGIYYMGPGLPSIVSGLALFTALCVYRPQLGLVMVVVAAPLFYRPRLLISNLYFPLPEVVIVCCALAWILRDGYALIRTRRLPDIRSWLREPGVWLALALATIGTLWLLVPPDALRKIALREYRWTVLEPLIFFALMLRWLRTDRDVWRMVGAWLIIAALAGNVGAYQFLNGETWSMEGVGRVTSVYPSATAFGIYMGRALPIALTLTFFLPKNWSNWRWASGLLAMPMAAGIVFSFARGAWIGVFAAMLGVALVTLDKRLLVGLGVVVLGGLALLPFVNVDRITSAFDLSTQDNTGVARLTIWSAALGIIQEHPLTGIGQDQFLYADPKYGVPNVRFLTLSHPHNVALDFWLRLGLPGILWLAAALGWFAWTATRFWRTHRGTALAALALGLLASMVDFAVHGLLDMAYFNMDLALTFWLTAGLLVVITRKHRAT